MEETTKNNNTLEKCIWRKKKQTKTKNTTTTHPEGGRAQKMQYDETQNKTIGRNTQTHKYEETAGDNISDVNNNKKQIRGTHGRKHTCGTKRTKDKAKSNTQQIKITQDKHNIYIYIYIYIYTRIAIF